MRFSNLIQLRLDLEYDLDRVENEKSMMWEFYKI